MVKKKQPTEVLVAWCIDKSGSMGWLKDDTIDGFNAWLEEQQGIPGKAYLSLVQFNTGFEPTYVAMDLAEVPKLDAFSYRPAGGTALYDAVGVTIAGVEGWLANNPTFKGKVQVNIWTDGDENSSRRWRKGLGGLAQMMAQVEAKQKEGWIFSFLGSGATAWTEGEAFVGTFGVGNVTQVAQSGAGVRMSYAASSTATSSLRATGQAVTTNSVLNTVAMNAKTMKDYGIEDAEEALSGTTNKTE